MKDGILRRTALVTYLIVSFSSMFIMMQELNMENKNPTWNLNFKMECLIYFRLGYMHPYI